MPLKDQKDQAIPSQQLTVFFDADCGFCQASCEWLERHDKTCAMRFFPYQMPNLAELYPQVDLAHADRGLQTLLQDGRLLKNERAVAACLKKIPGCRWLGHLIVFPLFWPFCAIVYWIIARNRRRISRWLGLTACRLPSSTLSSAHSVQHSRP